MTVLVGIEYEINKGDVASFMECMVRDERTIYYIYEVVDYLHNSNEVFLKKAWSVLGKFFQELSGVLLKCTKEHITSTVKNILYRFLRPDGFIISKVFTVLWYGYDITKDIQRLMESTKHSNYFDVGTSIGKLIKIAEKIFQPIYEGFSTKEHAFFDGFTQEFTPEISNQLELCVGLDDESVFKQIESDIMKINKSSSKTEIFKIIKNITNIYLKVANNEFCSFGDLPMFFLNAANNKYSEWNQSLLINEDSIEGVELTIDYLLQAKEHFESKRFIAAGKILGKVVHTEMNINLIE